MTIKREKDVLVGHSVSANALSFIQEGIKCT